MTKKTKTIKKVPAQPVGAPTIFKQKQFNEICERISQAESLRSIMKDKGMPNRDTFYQWLDDEMLSDQYARARRMQADFLADEILEITDDGRNDWMEKFNKDGDCIGWVINGEAVARSRLRVDTRKWLACKFYPKMYGDKSLTINNNTQNNIFAEGANQLDERLAAIINLTNLTNEKKEND